MKSKEKILNMLLIACSLFAVGCGDGQESPSSSLEIERQTTVHTPPTASENKVSEDGVLIALRNRIEEVNFIFEKEGRVLESAVIASYPMRKNRETDMVTAICGARIKCNDGERYALTRLARRSDSDPARESSWGVMWSAENAFAMHFYETKPNTKEFADKMLTGDPDLPVTNDLVFLPASWARFVVPSFLVVVLAGAPPARLSSLDIVILAIIILLLSTSSLLVEVVSPTLLREQYCGPEGASIALLIAVPLTLISQRFKNQQQQPTDAN